MKVLDLVLMYCWYDMIEKGIKTEEYREIKKTWIKRFTGHDTLLFSFRNGYQAINQKGYTHVRFRRGYTSTTMLFELKDIVIGKGNIEWGADQDNNVFILKLGNRIYESN